MNRKILPFVFILGGYITNAKVGISSSTPNNSSQVEILSTDKVILIPQVSLKSSKDTSTIINGNINSLLVFNTATVSDIILGYYYCFFNSWLRLGYKSDDPASVNSLIWDSINNAFFYIDNYGNSQIVNLSKLLKDKETVTPVTNNGSREYTYKNKNGADLTISVFRRCKG